MEVTSFSGRLRLILIAGAFLGYPADGPADQFPPTAATMRAIGQRLSRSFSERHLTAIASRGDAVLRQLQPRERSALGRGYFRFKVDRPVVIDVAAPEGSIPFWIGDQGFRMTNLVLENPDTHWRIYRKTFPAGTVGMGVNGLDRTPVAHYVVFVRPRGPIGPAHEPPLVTVAVQQPSWQTTLARPGVSAARDFYKPFRSLPAELAGAILLQPSHSERHAALLAAGRVWKTRVVSSEHPSQVAISFGADASRELVWTWTTAPSVESTRIRITRDRAGFDNPRQLDQPAMNPDDRFRVVPGESTTVLVHDLLNDPVIRRHRVGVDRLEPETVYRYSLNDGTGQAWGPWRTVKTAPQRSDNLSFLYLGDAQTGLKRWGHLLAEAYRRHPGIDFILLAGDLVDRGNERTNWDHFFLRSAGIFDRVPLMPCVGNHEYLDVGPRLYRAFFELPRNGPGGIASDLAYHFESGDACFAVLDSTLAAFDPAAARQQADWLDATLAQTRASWKFVMLHHPIYPSHPWRDVPALRERFVPVFDRHHVDFVLQGHDHAYQRTYPLRGHKRARTPAEGTIYLMAVSGDKFVEQTERPYVEVGRAGVSTYQTFEIDPRSSRLIYRAWTEDGMIVDELSIAKAPKTDLEPDRLARSR